VDRYDFREELIRIVEEEWLFSDADVESGIEQIESLIKRWRENRPVNPAKGE
jgi:hypothetical protein